MKKLTEIDKLKYWLDAELSILHIMFAVVVLLLTDGFIVSLLLCLYIAYTLVYTIVRVLYLAQDDQDYLKVPKK